MWPVWRDRLGLALRPGSSEKHSLAFRISRQLQPAALRESQGTCFSKEEYAVPTRYPRGAKTVRGRGGRAEEYRPYK